MIKKYGSVSITALKPKLFEYIARVEAGEVIYIIKHSVIVAKIVRVDFGNEINKTSNLEGALIA